MPRAPSHFEQILDRIRETRNFDLRNYKRPTLQRRIQRRMDDRQCTTFEEYLALLDAEPEEIDALISTMLLKVTSFFRDEEVWSRLSQTLVPEILAQKRAGEELRIWSAGCSTGEEAFSLAITLAEVLGPAFHHYNLKIFGTDVDEAAVAHARRGIYSAEQVKGLDPKLVVRWFTRVPNGYAVRKEIRRVVVFGVNNLVSDAPISRIDLILCRNVFIYMDTELQKRVLTRFHYALRAGGVLTLGKSELIPFAGRIFSQEDTARRIYRKSNRHELPAASQERLVGLLEQEQATRAMGQAKEELSVLGQYYRTMLDALTLPIFTTGMEGSITFWSAAAARMWGKNESEVLGRKLAALGLPGLTAELIHDKTALIRNGQSEQEVAEGLLALPGRGQPTPASILVIPLREEARQLLGMLYIVSDLSDQRTVERELARLREEMNTANDKLQASNEELQSANEELETTNEELQSANEELQTTNEELQSANTELDATNRELAHRTEDMNRLGFYQRMIIRGLTAAIVVFDPKGKVTSWNLSAERLLGLTETEAVGQTFWTLRVPALEKETIAQIRRAVTAGRPLRDDAVAYKLITGLGGHAKLSTLPLIEREQNLGTLLLFEDVTRLAALAKENAQLRGTSGKGAAPGVLGKGKGGKRRVQDGAARDGASGAELPSAAGARRPSPRPRSRPRKS